MNRISVIGSSGSGKTTVARALAARLGVPLLELDAVFHQPGWVARPDEEFRSIVAAFAEGDRWVIDGNYTSHGVAQVVWPRADTIVWLDLPRRVVMRHVVGRTLRRVITREELWNGNREPLTNLYSRDPYKNIIVWAWTRYHPVRVKYESYVSSPEWAHARVVRLQSAREVGEFLKLTAWAPRRWCDAHHITTGPTADPPPSTTWCCCVEGTTAWPTRGAGRRSASAPVAVPTSCC